MTARAYQNKTKSGQSVIRSNSRSKSRTSSSSGSSRQSAGRRRRKSEKSNETINKSARAIWMMVLAGGLIGAIFILAQRLQISTLHLKRAEEGLKSEFDTLASQQRYLNFQKDKALSTQESLKAANEFNLAQPGVGRTVVRQETKPASETKPTVIKAVMKQPAVGKQAVATKQPGKIAKTVKVVPAGKAAKPVATSKPAQAGKSKKDNKQIAKNQPLRKGAR